MKNFLSVLLMTFMLNSIFLSDAQAANNKRDNLTPAEEGVCDVLTDATPGLYGLCIAYCEAQDQPVDLFDAEVLANLTAPAMKILKAYDRKKKDNDPAMPCLVFENECPAWERNELQNIGYMGSDNLYSVNDSETSVHGVGLLLMDKERGHINDGSIINTTATLIKYSDFFIVGTYSDDSGADDFSRWTWLSNEEYDQCKLQLLNHVVPTR